MAAESGVTGPPDDTTTFSMPKCEPPFSGGLNLNTVHQGLLDDSDIPTAAIIDHILTGILGPNIFIRDDDNCSGLTSGNALIEDPDVEDPFADAPAASPLSEEMESSEDRGRGKRTRKVTEKGRYAVAHWDAV